MNLKSILILIAAGVAIWFVFTRFVKPNLG